MSIICYLFQRRTFRSYNLNESFFFLFFFTIDNHSFFWTRRSDSGSAKGPPCGWPPTSREEAGQPCRSATSAPPPPPHNPHQAPPPPRSPPPPIPRLCSWAQADTQGGQRVRHQRANICILLHFYIENNVYSRFLQWQNVWSSDLRCKQVKKRINDGTTYI